MMISKVILRDIIKHKYINFIKSSGQWYKILNTTVKLEGYDKINILRLNEYKNKVNVELCISNKMYHYDNINKYEIYEGLIDFQDKLKIQISIDDKIVYISNIENQNIIDLYKLQNEYNIDILLYNSKIKITHLELMIFNNSKLEDYLEFKYEQLIN